MKLCVIALFLAASCSRREVVPKGIADSARRDVAPMPRTSSAAPSTAPVLPSSDAGVKREVKLKLITRPTAAPGKWEVAAMASEIHLNASITTFTFPQLCDVVPDYGLLQSNIHRADAPPAIIITCSGDDRGKRIEVEDSALKVNNARYPIPADVRVVLPTEIEQPPLLDCGDGGNVKLVDARVVRRSVGNSAKPESKEFEFDLLFSGERVNLGTVTDSPMSCGMSRESWVTNRVSYGCGYNESGFTLDLRVEPQRLWVERIDRRIPETTVGPRFGRQIPCNLRLRFRTFALRDRGWSGFGGACGRACFDGYDRCNNSCYERFTTAEDRLPDAGIRCSETCHEIGQRCEDACIAKGQYP